MRVIPEQDCRATSWTPGAIVTLADSSAWYLPHLDLPLLATQPGLIAAIKRVLGAASDLAKLDPEVENDLALATFDHYADLTQRLLLLNYELTDLELGEILPADRGDWFADLVIALGDALVLAIVTDWRPFASAFFEAAPAAVLAN